MPETELGEVNRHAFQIAYYSDDPNEHTMNVEALAPALAAFGRLFREVNGQINGNRATIKILVTSHFEHKCFSISFEIIQTVLDKLKSFLADGNVQTATELLKLVGIVGSAGGTIGGTLFGFLKWKNGRKIKSAKQSGRDDASQNIRIEIEGDGNTVNITRNVFKLAENKKILDAVAGALTPIETRDAERVEFRETDHPNAVYDRAGTKAIVRSCDIGPDNIVADASKPASEVIVTTLYVYGPVYDAKAPNWRFLYKKKPIYADISDTTIAKDALRRGGALANDRYRVRMEITPPDVEGGDPHHTILEVLDFTPAPQQVALPLKTRTNRKRRKRT